jgi:hypothetical protein
MMEGMDPLRVRAFGANNNDYGGNGMSILSWLKTVSTGGASGELAFEQPMVFAAGEEEFRGLNMREALDAHIGWTHRLEAILKGRSEEHLNPAVIGSDHHCTLGEWIHGEAKRRFGDLPEYVELESVHAAFHQKVAQIVRAVDSGANANTQGSIKEIRRMSGDVQLALVRLYAHHEE